MDQIRLLGEIIRENGLNDNFNATALNSLMVGKARAYYEHIETEEDDYDILVKKCREYATRKGLEANSRKTGGNDSMDIGVVNGKTWECQSFGNSCESGGHWWENEEENSWVNALGDLRQRKRERERQELVE